jgi:predicted Zn-dependent protease
MKGLKFAGIALLLMVAIAFGDGTRITAPKNNYELADDVKVGREAATQIRRELPLLPEEGEVDAYVERVGNTLSAAIPPEFAHREFHYEFSVVNAKDINAFALPGGPMFVNRGMIEAAHSEGEMAGVMAHEISHVALRHGTAQATKSQSAGIQLGAIGGAILGAIIGGDAGDIVAQGTQIGLGTYLLKFSREYETQADILGAQILARAGYDPMDLAKMFQTIEQQGGSSGPEWLSSHPNPGNRYQRINEESRKLTVAQPPRSQSTEFTRIQTSLKRMAPAATSDEIAKSRRPESGTRYPDDARMGGTIERPSTQYRTVAVNGAFQVSVPTNWREFRDGSSITVAPDGGYGNVQGQSVFTHGAIIGAVTASSRDLTRESDQLISGILDGNAYLNANGKYQRVRIDGHEALRMRLTGTSPVTNRREIVDLYTALTGRDQLFHMIQVVPASDQASYRTAFDQMARSARLSN